MPPFCSSGLLMQRARPVWPLAAVFAFLPACSNSEDSIDKGGQVFDAISEEATISLLGNEPFWGIEVRPDGGRYTATYSTPQNIEGASFAVDRFAGNNGLGFSGEVEGEPIQITLTPGECNDTMSDNIYPYTATVALGDDTLFGCGYTDVEPFVQGENS